MPNEPIAFHALSVVHLHNTNTLQLNASTGNILTSRQTLRAGSAASVASQQLQALTTQPAPCTSQRRGGSSVSPAHTLFN